MRFWGRPQNNWGRSLSFSARRVRLERGMMMPIDLHQGLHTHAEVSGSLVRVGAGLHLPRGRCVAHDVGPVAIGVARLRRY